MPTAQLRPTFAPRLVMPGSEWCVLVRWPDEQAEPVGGFKSLPEAEEWITREADRWLDERLHAAAEGSLPDGR